MYVLPNTNIKIIKNCPLDPTQDHTIYFTSVNQQTAFFINTLDGYLIPSNSYQRVDKNKMRIARNAESLYNCNYLAFQNASFGSKWFYAFITSIEYINNVTSEITYQIDVMQTWHFNYVLMDCFVEREHSLTDEIGDNIVPEKIDTGEYVCSNLTSISDLDDYKICIWATIDSNYNDVAGVEINQGYQACFSGLTPTIFPLTTAGVVDAVNWLFRIPFTKANAVVSINVIPSIALNALYRTQNIAKVTTLMRSDGTSVKNKKCLTYPYNFLYVSNNQGRSANYRYEFFSTDNCQLGYFADESPNPSVFLFPKNYKGLVENFDEVLSFSGFPQISWNVDSYKAWLAQSASSLGVNLFSGAFALDATQSTASTALVPFGAMAGSTAAFNSAGIPLGAAIPLATLAAQVISGSVHAAMPPHAHGNQQGSTLLSFGKLNYQIMNKHITPEFATIIDDYFSRFGYATNKLKRPNRNVRKEWTYVKTIGCCIDGTIDNGLPASAMAEICKIYDNGITFWNNPVHIGDYTLDNSPIIGGE